MQYVRFFVGIVLCLFFVELHAQVRCTNRLLADLAEQLPDIDETEGRVCDYVHPKIGQGVPLVIQRNVENDIHHIGVKLFDREVIAKHPSNVYYFMERYFLELLLMPNDQEARTKMKMDRVGIASDVFALTSIKKGLRNIIQAFSENSSVYITCNSNRYNVSIIQDMRALVKMSFPVRYELITGNTKLEAENSVYTALLEHQEKPYQSLDEKELFVYNDSLYCANDDYYVTEEIVSTAYYKKVEKAFVPVFSPDMLAESVFNLFNSGYDWKVQAEVTQNMYGNKKKSFTLPLSKLVDFMTGQSCTLYTGIRKYDKSVVQGVVMAVNFELGYQHMLIFSFDRELLQSPEDKLVKIKMFSYIPMHNVSSLFNEKETKRK